jgi:hypothetical protein
MISAGFFKYIKGYSIDTIKKAICRHTAPQMAF